MRRNPSSLPNLTSEFVSTDLRAFSLFCEYGAENDDEECEPNPLGKLHRNEPGWWGYLRWVGGTVGGDRTVVVEVGEGLAVVMKDCVTVGGWGYLRWVFVGRRRKFLAVVEAGEGTGGSEENERL
uniref:Uncharacterized protein n=1 Tax=Fagus sylvatica TaxID=28930 RepID=A0A2N9JAU5_FAGSY